MTEQQEQSEETGLLSTQDLDHSKDDDTHGHFRQIPHTHTYTHTLLCNTCCLFTRTPSVSCAWSWVTTPGDLFSQHLFCAFISAVFDVKQWSNMHTHARKETTNRDLQREHFKCFHQRPEENICMTNKVYIAVFILSVLPTFNIFVCNNSYAQCWCVSVLYKEDSRDCLILGNLF